MAYKFQLGAATLGGKVTAAGLDAGDQDIDNVADIAVASISADGSDITVVATDNREAAFQVSSSAAGPILFVDTSTGAESAFAPKGLAVDMDGEVKVRSNSGRMELHVSGAASALMELGDLQIDVNQKIRISGSQPLEFADNNHKLVKNGATMELFAAGAKRLTAKNGGVDVEGALHADTLDIADPSSLAGNGLARNGTTLDIGVDNSGIELASDALRLKDGGVTADKMANLAATNLYVGNGSNRPVAVALSGDVTMDNAGAVTIAAAAVEDGMLNDNVASGLAGNGLASASGVMSVDLNQLSTAAIASGDFLAIVDATDNSSKRESIDDVAALLAGNGLSASSAVISIALRSNQGLIIDSDELAVDLDSDALQFTSGRIDLKDSIAGARTFQSDVTVAGDLIVQGTTVTLDVATVGITGSFSFEGSTADAFETTLGVIDPTADRALNLPNIDGNIGAFSNASWQTARSAVSVSEIDLVGAGAGSSVTLASGDGFLMFDATDSNNTKKALLSDIATFVGNTGRLKPGAGTIVASDITISSEVTLVDTTAARTLTMPDITDADVGKVYVIKDVKGAGAFTNNISIARSSSGHQIDGTNGLTLESDRVAISLIACKDGATFFYSIY